MPTPQKSNCPNTYGLVCEQLSKSTILVQLQVHKNITLMTENKLECSSLKCDLTGPPII